MPTGNFISGLLSGLGDGLQSQREQENKDLVNQLIKAQVKAAELKARVDANKQSAIGQIGGALSGDPGGTQDLPPSQADEGQLTQPSAPRGISDILADKGMIGALLQSGLAPQLTALQQLQQPGKRETAEDVEGRVRDVNSGKLVFPEATPPPRIPLSKEGKRLADLTAIQEKFGADSAQSRAFQESISPVGQKPPDFGDVSATRREFSKASEDNAIALSAFDRMASVAKTPTGAGDIAMIFQFMKLLDPGSRVTEGEVALAGQVSGAAGKFLNLYNRLVKGERLTQSARQDLMFQAGNIAEDIISKQRRLEGEFTGIAERGGVDSRDVVRDFIGGSEKNLEGLGPPDKSLDQSIGAAEKALNKVTAFITGGEDDAQSPGTDLGGGFKLLPQ